MTKDELKVKIADLKVKAFPVAQPVDADFYTELRKAQDALESIERKEREADFHQRYSAEIADQKRQADALKAVNQHELYRSF